MNTPSKSHESDKMTSNEFVSLVESTNFDSASRQFAQEERTDFERLQFIQSISNQTVREKLARRTYGVSIATTLGFIQPEVEPEDHREFVGFTQINAKL